MFITADIIKKFNILYKKIDTSLLKEIKIGNLVPFHLLKGEREESRKNYIQIPPKLLRNCTNVINKTYK